MWGRGCHFLAWLFIIRVFLKKRHKELPKITTLHGIAADTNCYILAGVIGWVVL